MRNKGKEKARAGWLTVEEVGQIMGVSRDTVSRLIAFGNLPAVLLRSGKRKKTFRVRPEALQAWALAKEKSHGEGTPMRRPKLRIPASGSTISRPFKNGDRAPADVGKSLLVSTQFPKGAQELK